MNNEVNNCKHDGQVYMDNGPVCISCGLRLQWVQAKQLKSVEKEYSEERKLKTRVLDKYADYLIEEAELLKKLALKDKEIEYLKGKYDIVTTRFYEDR